VAADLCGGRNAFDVFNTLVLIIQSFQKIEPLHALAPLGNEPTTLACQVILLLGCIAAGILAVLRFKPVMTISGISLSLH
jgi:hypothetical protein